MPKEVTFQPTWQIALAMIDGLHTEGVPPAPIWADAGYGVGTAFRDALTERQIPYVVGIRRVTTVWPPGREPWPPKRRAGTGRPPLRIRRSLKRPPAPVLERALHAPASRWRDICGSAGTRGKMSARFFCGRVRPAHRDENRRQPREVEWGIAERPRGESEPPKFWLATMPPDAPVEQLIRLAKLRWRIERDYEELKGSVGLDHDEGRGWRGFHHHGALWIAPYAFLAAEHARLSPPEPLAYPAVSSRGVRPVWTSIETMCRGQSRALLQLRPCSWCGRGR